jgi:hypothetical protein
MVSTNIWVQSRKRSFHWRERGKTHLKAGSRPVSSTICLRARMSTLLKKERESLKEADAKAYVRNDFLNPRIQTYAFSYKIKIPHTAFEFAPTTFL